MSFTLWFMGRPASGKSTLAKQVENYLREKGLQVENLDGDDLRTKFHPDLGFTRGDREINNRRTAYIAQLLNRNDIPTIVAMITPFRDAQQQAREIVEEEGDFFLVYVKASTEACADRDPKGLYEDAEAGKIENFTGVNHPFQEPHDPDVIVDTENSTVEECLEEILTAIEGEVLDSEPIEDYEFDITRDEEAEIESRLQDMGYLE
jgi:adenylylsulfate kinase